MRVALVRQRPDGGVGNGVPGLLARPLAELAADLAALGHRVLIVETVGATARRGATSGPSLEALERLAGPGAAQSPSIEVTVCTTRRGLLAVLDPALVDVALVVGRRAAESVERIASDLAVPWLWSPEQWDLPSEPGGAGPWLPRHAERFVAGSAAEADLLVSAGIRADRCDVVPWQLAMPARGSRVLGDVPESVASVLTSAGAGAPGVADLIRAVALLPELRLRVAVDAGTGSAAHVLDRWSRLAAGLRAGHRIRFVRVASGESLRVLVHASDLVVSMPHGPPETSLLATAMWAGTPLVASDVPGVRELVESGATGLLLPAAQPRRLARALRVIGRDAPARATWSWSAHRRAVERLEREATAITLARALAVGCSLSAAEPVWGHAAERLDGVAAG